MEIVAIYQLQGSADQLARDLAGVLGTTPYEARSRVSIPGGGPAVVANFATPEQAADCVARLTDAGFHSLALSSGRIESDLNRLLVRQLQFAADNLKIVTENGRELDLPYHKVELLLRGAGIVSSVQVETGTKKTFALGRAVATGGLMMSKKVKTRIKSTNQERQPFCHLYAPGLQPLVLRQAAIDYTSLGADRQLSRDANFTWICAELRRRCTNADWDDRLLTKPGLAQVLGPAFDPELYLDLAVTLIVLVKEKSARM